MMVNNKGWIQSVGPHLWGLDVFLMSSQNQTSKFSYKYMRIMTRLPSSIETTRMYSTSLVRSCLRIEEGAIEGNSTIAVLNTQSRIRVTVQQGFVQNGFRKGLDTLVLSTIPRYRQFVRMKVARDTPVSVNSPVLRYSLWEAYLSILKLSMENRQLMKPSWARNWMTSCPTMEDRARMEKKEPGGSSLLRRETGLVRLMVMKMGKVTKRSSQSIWLSVMTWQSLYSRTTVVNWTRENRIIMLKEWKLVARAARQMMRQWVTQERFFASEWKLLRTEHSPLSSSRDKWAYSDTLPPDPTAKDTSLCFSVCRYTFLVCLFSISLKMMVLPKIWSPLSSSRFMNSSSYNFEVRLTLELWMNSADSCRNSWTWLSGPEDYHSMCPRQSTLPLLRLHSRSSFFVTNLLWMAMELASSSPSSLTRIIFILDLFSYWIAFSVSSFFSGSRIANPQKMNSDLSFFKSLSLSKSFPTPLQAKQISLNPFSAMSTTQSCAVEKQVSPKHKGRIFAAGPFMNTQQLFEIEAPSPSPPSPPSLLSSLSPLSPLSPFQDYWAIWAEYYRESGSWWFSSMRGLNRTLSFSLISQKTASFLSFSLKNILSLISILSLRHSWVSGCRYLAFAKSYTFFSSNEPDSLSLQYSRVWHTEKARISMRPRSCTSTSPLLSEDSHRLSVIWSPAVRSRNCFRLWQFLPIPLCDCSPTIIDCISYFLPKILLASITMVVARPPAKMLDGRMEWMPFWERRCWAKVVPTLRAVGRVMGMEMASRSRYRTNRLNLEMPSEMVGMSMRKTRVVRASMMQRKRMVSLVKFSVGFFWCLTARRYLPLWVLQLVWLTMQAISLACSTSAKNQWATSGGAASTTWLSSGLTDWFLFTFTILVPRYRMKFFSFSLQYEKPSSPDFLTRQSSPVMYSSSSRASPDSTMQSHGTTSPSLRISRSPGSSSLEFTSTLSSMSLVPDLKVSLPLCSEWGGSALRSWWSSSSSSLMKLGLGLSVRVSSRESSREAARKAV